MALLRDFTGRSRLVLRALKGGFCKSKGEAHKGMYGDDASEKTRKAVQSGCRASPSSFRLLVNVIFVRRHFCARGAICPQFTNERWEDEKYKASGSSQTDVSPRSGGICPTRPPLGSPDNCRYPYPLPSFAQSRSIFYLSDSLLCSIPFHGYISKGIAFACPTFCVRASKRVAAVFRKH